MDFHFIGMAGFIVLFLAIQGYGIQEAVRIHKAHRRSRDNRRKA